MVCILSFRDIFQENSVIAPDRTTLKQPEHVDEGSTPSVGTEVMQATSNLLKVTFHELWLLCRSCRNQTEFNR